MVRKSTEDQGWLDKFFQSGKTPSKRGPIVRVTSLDKITGRRDIDRINGYKVEVMIGVTPCGQPKNGRLRLSVECYFKGRYSPSKGIVRFYKNSIRDDARVIVRAGEVELGEIYSVRVPRKYRSREPFIDTE